MDKVGIIVVVVHDYSIKMRDVGRKILRCH